MHFNDMVRKKVTSKARRPLLWCRGDTVYCLEYPVNQEWQPFVLVYRPYFSGATISSTLKDMIHDMHFVWFSMWDGFFSPRVSESRLSRVATRVGFRDEWWEIHLTWKTIQNVFSRILYTLRHFNQAKYTVQSCRSWKPCEMDLSHNCSLHGGMSEVCEKYIYTLHHNIIQ